ncbi:hypothetical protein BG004_001016 [Podila humilis]|nr:hypothetical protein BG004_001016 [Podila humilis]
MQQQQQQQQQPPSAFSDNDEDDDDENDSDDIHSRSVTRTHAADAVVERASRRNSTIRPQSITVATVVSIEGDTPDSPPPKYTTEDLEYSDPAHPRGRDEVLGGLDIAGTNHSHGDGLLMQALTTLVIAVSGLICAGWLLDVIQHWQVFIDISELIILIPILLNLKGNLEMNLASRLSTASLAVGSIAGLFSFGLGVLVHPATNNMNEIALMITASMLCASFSSLVLGGFMCGLVLVCRKYHINPASSFGDLVTLVILAGCAVTLQKFIDSPLSIVLLFCLLGLIPAWLVYVRRNKFVRGVVKEGWVPVLAAMVISSTAGLTLERYINEFPGMALISPVLNGLIGNIGSIYASRISTSLHSGVKEHYKATERTLFYVHLPIEIIFMALTGALGLGHIQWSVAVVLGYLLVSLLMVVIALWMAKKLTHSFWRWGYNPDNYVLPILTSLLDVIGTAFLVAGFLLLQYSTPSSAGSA